MQSGGKIFNGQKLFEYRYSYFDVTQWILAGKIGKTRVSMLFDGLSVELCVYKAASFMRGWLKRG